MKAFEEIPSYYHLVCLVLIQCGLCRVVLPLQTVAKAMGL